MRWLKTAHAPLACAFLMLLCLSASSGCGHNARDLKLDKEAARQSLTAFLDCWKEGQSPETLQSRQPAITGRDFDWEAGRKLVRYALGEEANDGTNLRITAELVLATARGEAPKKTVDYIVGTSPVITVFRGDE